MSKLFIALISLVLITQLVQSQNSQQYNWLYTGSGFKSGGSASFYDLGSSQVFVTPTGYSVVNTTTGQVSLYNNPTCVGTSQGQFFCIDQQNPMNFNEVNLTLGVESATFTFNQTIVQLYSYFNSVLVQFNQYFTQVAVMVPPSTSPVCVMNITSGNTKFGSATYFNGSIFLTSNTQCSKTPCPYYIYNCSSNNLTTYNMNFTKDIKSGFTLIPMYFSNENTSALVGFPIDTNGNSDSNQGGANHILLNSNFTLSKALGEYGGVVQVNQTNILVTYENFTTVQFTFNFSSGQFDQVGGQLLLPITTKNPVTFVSPVNPTLIAVSGLLHLSNIYVNLSSMAVENWRYLETPLQLFGNGSFYVPNARGYIVGSPNSFYVYTNVSSVSKKVKKQNNHTNNNTKPSNKTTVNVTQTNKFINYNSPQAYPNMAFAIQIATITDTKDKTNQWTFMAMNLSNISNSNYYPINLTNLGDIEKLKINSVVTGPNSSYTFAITNNGKPSVVNTQIGLLSPDFSDDDEAEYTQEIGSDDGGDTTMYFMNSNTNTSMFYTAKQSFTMNMTNWTVYANNTFPSQFNAFVKMTEGMFLGYSMNSVQVQVNNTNSNSTNSSTTVTVNNLNISVVDAFQQTLINNWVITNVSDKNLGDYWINFNINPSTISLSYVTVSWLDFVNTPQNWVLFPNGTISNTSFGTVVIPGPYQTLQACDPILNDYIINCTLSKSIPTPYVPPSPGPNPNPNPTPAPIPIPSQNVTIVTLYNPPTPDSKVQYSDLDGYQVYLSSEGYSVVNKTNGVLTVYNNPNCVGSSNGLFFCVSQFEGNVVNQADITTGLETNFVSFSSSVYSFSSYFNSLIAVFDENYYDIKVFLDSSNTLVCSMDLTNNTDLYFGFVSALYYTGNLFLDAGDCYGGYCDIAFYDCASTNASTALQTQVLTYSTTDFPNDFDLTTIVLTSGSDVAVFGFPISESANTGYFDLVALEYIPTTWNFVQVLQVNQTNILVVDSNGTSVQYTYNFTSSTFVQVGVTFNVPDSYQAPYNLISNVNPTLLSISNILGLSNFYANLNTMTINDWVYSEPAQTFYNGSAFAFHTLGYIVGSSDNFYYWSEASNYTYFYAYVNPSAFPDMAYALGVQPYGPEFIWQLFTLNLSSNTSQPNLINIPTNIALTSFPEFASLTIEGSNYILSVTAGDLTYFVSTEAGLLYTLNNSNPTPAPALLNKRLLTNLIGMIDPLTVSYSQGGSPPMVFTDATAGIVMYYAPGYTLELNMTTFDPINNGTFSTQFGAFYKLTDTLFLGWSFDQFTQDLNISVINAFTFASVQNLVLSNTNELDISGFDINGVVNNVTQNVSYITVYASTLGSTAQNWLIFPNNTVLYANNGDMLIPGPDNTIQMCAYQLGGNLMNCTLIPNPSPLPNPTPTPDNNGGSNGMSGLVIALIAIGVVVIAGGVCVIRKRGGSSSSHSKTPAKGLEENDPKNGVQMISMNA